MTVAFSKYLSNFNKIISSLSNPKTPLKFPVFNGIFCVIYPYLRCTETEFLKLCLDTMIKSSLLRSCTSPLLLDAKDPHRKPSSSARFSSTISCSSRSQAYIPKLEPFCRSKIERAVKEPPLIEKSEKELADYCSTLEGEESYGCWQAYFELKDLVKESPKADIERLILETGGVKSLIGCLHGIANMHKLKKNRLYLHKQIESEEGQRHCPIPDGLPKSAEEMMEEEQARMPDSPFTRLLRSKGRFPAWYSPSPDHQTD